MSRLTNKDDDNVYRISGFTTIDELIDKLAIYEDLEEQIGCPLEVVFKAISQGNIWVKKEEEIINTNDYYLDCNGLGYWFLSVGKGYYDIVGLKDYKKNWWLKEDRSE